MADKWNVAYYDQFFSYMRSKHAKNGKSVTFIAASDSKDWVKKQDVLPSEETVNISKIR